MAPATFDEFKALYEQPAEMAPDLPTPMKGGNGPRFGASEAPVEHVAGTDNVPLPRPKAQRKATPIGPAMPLPLDPEMAARVVAFAIEREAIRARKEAGQAAPWTDDPILSKGYFCNVHREHDKVTRWIADNWRDPHRDDPDLWFAMAVARCINEPAALAELGWPLPFDAEHMHSVLAARQLRGDKVFRTDAYKPPTPPQKSMSTISFLVKYVLGQLWRDGETLCPQSGETLRAYSDRLREHYRIGPFLAGQIIADLKHVEPLRSASDWWTFAVPGPGSKRGLNRVCKREVDKSWSEPVWHGTCCSSEPRSRRSSRPRTSLGWTRKTCRTCFANSTNTSGRAMPAASPRANTNRRRRQSPRARRKRRRQRSPTSGRKAFRS
jgi:hypothetical protein